MARAKKTVTQLEPQPLDHRRSGRAPIVSPATLRSVVAVVLLAAGAITLIALFLPGGGILNGYVDGFLRPLFGQGAWLLAVLLLVAGVLVERAPSVDYSWVTVALGGLIVFIGGQGLIHLFSGKGGTRCRPASRVGERWATRSPRRCPTCSAPSAPSWCSSTIVLVGILLLFDITLVAFVTPFTNAGRSPRPPCVAGAHRGREPRRCGRDGVTRRTSPSPSPSPAAVAAVAGLPSPRPSCPHRCPARPP